MDPPVALVVHKLLELSHGIVRHISIAWIHILDT